MSESARDDMEAIGARPVVVPINAGQDEPEKEPSLLPHPMSPTARVIVDRSTAALQAAQIVWDQAYAEHIAALNVALKLDDLPPIGKGKGELRFVGRNGDQWVEPNQPRR